MKFNDESVSLKSLWQKVFDENQEEGQLSLLLGAGGFHKNGNFAKGFEIVSTSKVKDPRNRDKYYFYFDKKKQKYFPQFHLERKPDGKWHLMNLGKTHRGYYKDIILSLLKLGLIEVSGTMLTRVIQEMTSDMTLEEFERTMANADDEHAILKKMWQKAFSENEEEGQLTLLLGAGGFQKNGKFAKGFEIVSTSEFLDSKNREKYESYFDEKKNKYPQFHLERKPDGKWHLMSLGNAQKGFYKDTLLSLLKLGLIEISNDLLPKLIKDYTYRMDLAKLFKGFESDTMDFEILRILRQKTLLKSDDAA